jgi:BirA family transcriptional regulator, biotin operon repressor / biotin---[acetyl-CoA-carboxylase] ligase
MWRLVLLEEIDSTNTYAREGVAQGSLVHGDVVQARHQRTGRGRFATRTWEDAPGHSLLMSVVLTEMLREHVSKVTFTLALAAASAIREAVDAEAASRVRIKWPNDVLIGHKKVAGILAEAVWSGAELRGVVAGIGVNVSEEKFSAALQDTATSLRLEGAELSVDEFRDLLLQHFSEELKQQSDERIFMERVSSELAWLSTYPTLTIDLLDGVALQDAQYLGVSSSGALMVRHDGVDHILHAASIRL